MAEETGSASSWEKARRVNWSVYGDRIRVRVICPTCGSGGAHDLFSYRPKCGENGCTDILKPASNNEVECEWEEIEAHADKLLAIHKKVSR